MSEKPIHAGNVSWSPDYKSKQPPSLTNVGEFKITKAPAPAPEADIQYECPCGHKWKGDGSDMNCPSCNPPEADSEGSLKFQDGICPDCESQDLCIQDNGCHNTGKIFSRTDRSTCEKSDSTSESPSNRRVEVRANNHKDCPAMVVDASDFAWAMQQVEARERELAQAIKERDEMRRDAEASDHHHSAAISAAELAHSKTAKQLATLREAAQNLIDVEGRHNTQIAFERLKTALVNTNQNRGEQL